jgi:hypothetical protein
MSKLREMLYNLVEESLLVEEKKDHIIRKIPSLSSEQRDELIELFKNKPHLENKIEWSKYRYLTWEDFDEVLNYESNTERKKKVKTHGIKGLKIGKDYIPLKEPNDAPLDYEGAYMPLSYEASKFIASNRIGNCTGRWCTAKQRSSEDWNKYIYRDKIVLVYIVYNDTKYALAIYKNPEIWELFDSENEPLRDLPGLDVDELISDNIRKIEEVRDFFSETDSTPIDIIGGFSGVRHTINADGSVHVKGDVNLSNKDLTELPIEFDVVDGNFNISGNKITSLDGCPKYVGGDFNCGDNSNLRTLTGGPEEVKGDFNCSFTGIDTLVGGPEEVGGNYDAARCNITILDGAPEKINGTFRAIGNKLETLFGSPSFIGGNFLVQSNRLTSLEGAPRLVNGKFVCTKNTNSFDIEDVQEVTDVKGDIRV